MIKISKSQIVTFKDKDLNEIVIYKICFRIQIPQMSVDGVFRPALRRSNRRHRLRPLDESKAVNNSRTDDEVYAGKIRKFL